MTPHKLVCQILVSCFLALLPAAGAMAGCDRPLALAIPDWRRGGDAVVPERHGFSFDQKLWTAVLGSIGCKVTWKYLPVKRLMSGIEQGSIDGAAPSLAAPGREQFAQFSDAYRTIDIVGFVRTADLDRLAIQSAEDLRTGDMRIGFPLGGWYGENLQSVIEDAQSLGGRALFSDDGEVMFAWLQSSRVDILIAPKQLGETYVLQQGLAQQIATYPTIFNRQSYRLMLRRTGGGLPDMAEVNGALAEFLKSPEHAALVRELRDNLITR